MKTWPDVQKFIDANDLPYKVVRFNMSLYGVLIDTFDQSTVADTVKTAEKYLKAV